MIKKIFVKQLNQVIHIQQPYIIIKFVDVKNYRDFCYNINGSIIYSINNEKEDIDKILFILDPINIELNNKKIITALYKKLIKYISSNFQEQISKIEKNIYELFDELIDQTNYDLNYDGELDINKVLSMYQLELKETKEINYLEFLVNYIKLNIEINNYNLIISFNLTKILTEEELELLKKELKLLNISIIDVIIEKDTSKITYLNIDNDWNVF